MTAVVGCLNAALPLRAAGSWPADPGPPGFPGPGMPPKALRARPARVARPARPARSVGPARPARSVGPARPARCGHGPDTWDWLRIWAAEAAAAGLAGGVALLGIEGAVAPGVGVGVSVGFVGAGVVAPGPVPGADGAGVVAPGVEARRARSLPEHLIGAGRVSLDGGRGLLGLGRLLGFRLGRGGCRSLGLGRRGIARQGGRLGRGGFGRARLDGATWLGPHGGRVGVGIGHVAPPPAARPCQARPGHREPAGPRSKRSHDGEPQFRARWGGRPSRDVGPRGGAPTPAGRHLFNPRL